MSINKFKFKTGIVKTKKHPVLKFGQVVSIIEETDDLYRVKVHANSLAEIISKQDLSLNNEKL
jgi:hypothetical protein